MGGLDRMPRAVEACSPSRNQDQQVIPDAAVEAAWLASLRNDVNKADITRILEAAAPFIADRAYNAGHLDGMNGAPNRNPCR